MYVILIIYEYNFCNINYSNIEKTDIAPLGKDRPFNIKSLNFMLGLRQYLIRQKAKIDFLYLEEYLD
jgi:hypothetical protein